ncbi:MAG: hypothetical protein K2X47_16605 [Bdellovibrionales bacterium]|nr:hypothetical protein [Bdellovibrionales bacterium]
MNTKKMMIQIGLISLTLVLIGCGQNNQQGRQTVQTQPNPQYPGGGGQPINPGSATPGAEFQVQGGNLQQAIQALTEVNATPVTVGDIGQTQGTGVFVSALATLSVPLQQAMSTGAQIVAQNSALVLRARDSYSGQTDPSTGAAIPDITVRITPDVAGFRAQGQVQPGGRFNLVYGDNYGQIMVDGQISGQMIQGQIGFQNAGRQPLSIGQFSAPVCAVFRCQ